MTTRSAVYSKSKKHNSRTYRSGLQETNAAYLQSRSIVAPYESSFIEYTIPETAHKYTPDFVLPNGILVETKGVWDSQDRKKHVLIKQQHPYLDIRFVFSRSKTKIYKGSKTTYASFCEANGFKYADKVIPDEWLLEPPKVVPKGVLKEKKKNNVSS